MKMESYCAAPNRANKESHRRGHDFICAETNRMEHGSNGVFHSTGAWRSLSSRTPMHRT